MGVVGDSAHGYGVRLYSNYVTIKECYFDNLDEAILFESSDRCLIRGNICLQSGTDDIHLQNGCEYNNIIGNYIYNWRSEHHVKGI